MNRVCKVEGCVNIVKQSGYCSKHHSQIYRHGRLTPELEREKNYMCKYNGCGLKAKSKGLCETHYIQSRNGTELKAIIKRKNIIKDNGEYIEVQLENRQCVVVAYALIDKDLVSNIYEYKWYYDGRYVSSGKGLLMHRVIINAKENEIVDHINGNTLDNRKENLRICNVKENAANHKRYITNTSGFNGVYASGKKWRARIKTDGKLISIGTFDDKEEAIRARRQAEIKYYGEFSPYYKEEIVSE